MPPSPGGSENSSSSTDAAYFEQLMGPLEYLGSSDRSLKFPLLISSSQDGGGGGFHPSRRGSDLLLAIFCHGDSAAARQDNSL
jgi:hypothetical protein